jgi:peptide/nickel transport system permease protein
VQSSGAVLVTRLCCFGCAVELAPFYHVFGTDQVGNDVLYQALKSIRTGLLIGTAHHAS